MRKIFLTAALAAISGVAVAQQRLSLYEEFSGENCAPCAAYNPGLWSLLNAGTNPSKVLLIKYQSPIPSAGPIYNAYKTVTNARLTYYSVPFAPYGRIDGTQYGTGNIASTTQANINQATAVAAPFTISATHAWIANGDSVRITVNLAAISAYAPTGANLKLRMALIEHLQYDAAPGTNGETEFHNVVREMYPNALGTQLANNWTVGQSQTLTLKGRVPSYVNKAPSGLTRIAVWVQDDNNKSVAQAGVSTYVPLSVDMASAALQVPASLVCVAGGASVGPVLKLENTGTNTLTSSTIYYKVDAGAWQTYNWTGSLAATATTNVTLPTLAVAAGTHTIADSVAMPNGVLDINRGNDRKTVVVNVRNTAGVPLPIATGFENSGALPTNWLLYDLNKNAQNWVLAGSATTTNGHSGSHYTLLHDNYDYASGEVNYAFIPADNMSTANRELSFYEAYAPYEDTSIKIDTDRLEVVYSTNCGTTWTSIWNLTGATLATAPSTSSLFVPTTSQWRNYTINLSAVPAGALLAFRATSDFGNVQYVDDVELRVASVTATKATIAAQSLTLAPNPASTQSVLSFDLTQNETVSVQVVDAIGRVVATPAAGSLSSGPHQVIINTGNLAAGLYNIVLHTSTGSLTKHLVVAN
ncbi:MAG: choice-of-anchor J domain-containing protein [Janthinobacterium lividum]